MGECWSPSRKKRISLKSNGLCWYCGCNLVSTPHDPAEFTLDHLEPRSRGGNHKDDNLVVACRRCNTKKWGRSLEEYRYSFALSSEHHQARKALVKALYLLPISQAIKISEVMEWIDSQESEVVFYGEQINRLNELPDIEIAG